MTNPPTRPPTASELLAHQDVLRIAHEDAESAYRDLSGFKITLFRCPDGWHVDYDLADPLSAGGGPPYVIDPNPGTSWLDDMSNGDAILIALTCFRVISQCFGRTSFDIIIPA